MGLTMADCLKILKVAANATPQEIQTAFNRLAKIYHPDIIAGNLKRAANAEETRRFREMVEARTALITKIFITPSYETFSRKQSSPPPPPPPKPPKQEKPKYGGWQQAAYGAYAEHRIKQDWEYDTFGSKWDRDFEKQNSKREGEYERKQDNERKYRKHKKRYGR
jgi:hypothetical protein